MEQSQARGVPHAQQMYDPRSMDPRMDQRQLDPRALEQMRLHQQQFGYLPQSAPLQQYQQGRWQGPQSSVPQVRGETYNSSKKTIMTGFVLSGQMGHHGSPTDKDVLDPRHMRDPQDQQRDQRDQQDPRDMRNPRDLRDPSPTGPASSGQKDGYPGVDPRKGDPWMGYPMAGPPGIMYIQPGQQQQQPSSSRGYPRGAVADSSGAHLSSRIGGQEGYMQMPTGSWDHCRAPAVHPDYRQQQYQQQQQQQQREREARPREKEQEAMREASKTRQAYQQQLVPLPLYNQNLTTNNVQGMQQSYQQQLVPLPLYNQNLTTNNVQGMQQSYQQQLVPLPLYNQNLTTNNVQGMQQSYQQQLVPLPLYNQNLTTNNVQGMQQSYQQQLMSELQFNQNYDQGMYQNLFKQSGLPVPRNSHNTKVNYDPNAQLRRSTTTPSQSQRKKNLITITDPDTGRNVTKDIFHSPKHEPTSVLSHANASSSRSTPSYISEEAGIPSDIELQELCEKSGMPPPKYEHFHKEGDEFIMTVTCGQFSYTGAGQTEHGLKASAAEGFLKKYRYYVFNQPGSSDDSTNKLSSIKIVEESTIPSNSSAIAAKEKSSLFAQCSTSGKDAFRCTMDSSNDHVTRLQPSVRSTQSYTTEEAGIPSDIELQELCEKSGMPPPKYEHFHKEGDEFIMTVTCGQFSYTGAGQTEHGLKASAAEGFLKKYRYYVFKQPGSSDDSTNKLSSIKIVEESTIPSNSSAIAAKEKSSLFAQCSTSDKDAKNKFNKEKKNGQRKVQAGIKFGDTCTMEKSRQLNKEECRRTKIYSSKGDQWLSNQKPDLITNYTNTVDQWMRNQTIPEDKSLSNNSHSYSYKLPDLAKDLQFEEILKRSLQCDEHRWTIFDGSNVALSRWQDRVPKVFLCKDILSVVEYYQEFGLSNIIVTVPVWRLFEPRSKHPIKDRYILRKLKKEGILYCTPNRDYEDRYCIGMAVHLDGIIVSNDHFEEFQQQDINNRVLPYRLVDERRPDNGKWFYDIYHKDQPLVLDPAEDILRIPHATPN